MAKPEEGTLLHSRYLPTLVCGLTFLTYIATLWFHFNYDDNPQIVESPAVHSWRFLASYFKGDLWSSIQPHASSGYYRPMFLIWIRLNYLLFGSNPMGWHLTTVAMHTAVTYAVYLLASRISRDSSAAAIASLIFGVHPVHVEVVAWLSAVCDSLMALLFIASVLCYAKARERQHSRAWMTTSLLCYAFALLTKEPAVTLPFVIFVYACLYPEDSRRRWLASLSTTIPYLAITLAYLIVRARALHGLVHTAVPLSAWQMMFTYPSLAWFYMRLLLFPVGLSLCYDLPYVTTFGLRQVVLPALPVLVATVLMYLWVRRSRDSSVAFALVWLVAPLLPALDLCVLVRGDFVHDRYLYLPSVGFAILAGLLIRRLNVGRFEFLHMPALQLAVTALIAAPLALGAIRQQNFWVSDLSLFQRAAAIAPENDVARNNFAGWLLLNHRYPEAIPLYLSILQRSPQDWLASRSLGLAYYRLGKWSDAETVLAHATMIRQDDPMTFAYLGAAEMQLGNLGAAEKDLRRAIQILPQGMGYHYFLGMVLEKEGWRDAARAEYRAELANYAHHQGAKLRLAQIESSAAR